MKRFHLHRKADPSGISGTGIVAEGIEFTDGAVVLRWISTHRTTTVYESIQDVEAIHGHGKKTEVIWRDK